MIKYKCVICGKEYKKFSSWIFKHFEKKHSDLKIIKLKRIRD
jgi:hypothetical protein